MMMNDIITTAPYTDLSTESLNRRLSVLEARIGIAHRTSTVHAAGTAVDNNDFNNNNNNNNINERLSKLRHEYELKINASSSSSSSTATAVGGGVLSNLNLNLNNSTTNNSTTTNSANHNNKKELSSWKECQKLLHELDPGIALTHQQQPLLYKRQQVLASSGELATDFQQLDIILQLLYTGTRPSSSSSQGGGGANENHTGGTALTTTNTAVSSDSTSTTPGKKKKKTGGGGILGIDSNNNNKNTTAGQSSSSEQHQQKLDNNKSKQQQQEEEEERQRKASSDGANQLRLDQVTQAPIIASEYYGEVAINPSELQRMETLRRKLLNLNTRTTHLGQQLRSFLECYHTTMQAVSEKNILADEKLKTKSRTTKNTTTPTDSTTTTVDVTNPSS